MGLSPAKISIASQPPRAVIRIAGRAAVERARDFDEAVRRLVAEGVRDLYLDLKECPLLDSTFSGAVALLAEEKVGPEPMVRFILVEAKARIVDGLSNLEVLPLLRLAKPDEVLPVDAPLEELPISQSNRRDAGEFCLRAHRALMTLSPSNEARFRELEAMLAAELGEVRKP